MNRMLVGTGLIGLACLLGTAGCATEEAGMQSTSGSSSMSAAKGTASDALSDSLKACLARIPSDSSPGARMVAEQSCRDNDALREGVVGTATSKSGDRASAGTQGDSLEACMSRIPKDASQGQRMLAEESCKRDQLTHR